MRKENRVFRMRKFFILFAQKLTLRKFVLERFIMKNVFTVKNLAGMGVFTALAFVAYCIIPEIPIFPGTPADFLKLDFSNVFIILAGFMYGPIPAIIITIVKEALHLPFGTTMGVGEVANVIMTTAYLLFPTIMYRYKKGIKVVILALAIACVIQIGVSLVVNRFINFPFFIWLYKMPVTAPELFASLWWYVLLFNVIKSVSISLVTLILYKRVKSLFKLMRIMEK
jgi:riboflavin transporter FmnP